MERSIHIVAFRDRSLFMTGAGTEWRQQRQAKEWRVQGMLLETNPIKAKKSAYTASNSLKL